MLSLSFVNGYFKDPFELHYSGGPDFLFVSFAPRNVPVAVLLDLVLIIM